MNTLNTRRSYAKALATFAGSAREQPQAITRAHILNFKASLVSRGLSPKTIRHRLSVLKNFFAWCIDEGLHPGPNPVDGIKLPKSRGEISGRALSGAEVAALVAQAPRARDRAILLLLAGSGLRAQELVDLDERDYSPGFQGGETASVLIRHGKGGRVRRVSIPAASARAVQEYLDTPDARTAPGAPSPAGPGSAGGAGARLSGATSPLFQLLDGRGKRISYSGVYRLVRDCGARAGLGCVSPHDLRRTYVTLRLDAGDPLPAVQQAVGHASMVETAGYYRYRTAGPECKDNASDKECFPSLPEEPAE